jgi:hypothetical protein
MPRFLHEMIGMLSYKDMSSFYSLGFCGIKVHGISPNYSQQEQRQTDFYQDFH